MKIIIVGDLTFTSGKMQVFTDEGNLGQEVTVKHYETQEEIKVRITKKTDDYIIVTKTP